VPTLIDRVTELVLGFLLLVVLVTGALAVLAILRRRQRERYFERLDTLRRLYLPVIARLLAGELSIQQGLTMLGTVAGPDRVFVLERLLLEKAPTPAEVPPLRALCEGLGLVETWQRRLVGQSEDRPLRAALSSPDGVIQRVKRLGFLLRARSAKNLGLIRHQTSWPLLVQALADPHPDVRANAAWALGVIKEPQSFTPLVERLHTGILETSRDFSLWPIRSALASFPLKSAAGLLPSLLHPHPQVRYLAADIVREMVKRRAALEVCLVLEPPTFPRELCEVFLTRLCFDESSNVRARAAPVVAYLNDPRVTDVLITLLGDAEWFVRLRAVQAFAQQRCLAGIPDIARGLTDPHWRVREATTRALRCLGQVGIDHLFTHFLTTTDAFSREQIADEFQRAGIIPDLLAQFEREESDRAFQVIQRLTEMGKTNYLAAALRDGSAETLRGKFLKQFGGSLAPQPEPR
jgi:HEAT repeat protein